MMSKYKTGKKVRDVVCRRKMRADETSRRESKYVMSPSVQGFSTNQDFLPRLLYVHLSLSERTCKHRLDKNACVFLYKNQDNGLECYSVIMKGVGFVGIVYMRVYDAYSVSNKRCIYFYNEMAWAPLQNKSLLSEPSKGSINKFIHHSWPWEAFLT